MGAGGVPTLELTSSFLLLTGGLCLHPCRVSAAELQTHPELDTDGDGVLSEGEAQVPPCPLAWDSWRGSPHVT